MINSKVCRHVVRRPADRIKSDACVAGTVYIVDDSERAMSCYGTACWER
jgi:hypothetical protein